MKEVKVGDLWALGEHRLMCADSTQKDNILTLLNGGKADMILTDPPYNMGMGGGGCFKESTKNLKERIQKLLNFNAYNIQFYTELDIATIYIFTSKALVYDYMSIFEKYNCDILCWCKTNPTPFTGSTFLPNIEYLLCFTKPGKKIWNKSLKPMSVYSRYYLSAKEEGRKGVGDLHPTMKPVKLLQDKILVSSTPGGIVLDPFAGSGSSMAACENTGRVCYMLEYEPDYCNVIIDRWEKQTGMKAYRI